MTDRIDLSAGLRQIFETFAGDRVHAFVGRVEAFDSATMRAEIQPVTKRRVGDSFVDRPKLADVPVLFPSSGSLHIVFDLQPGTDVLCVGADHSLDRWLTTGQLGDPATYRSGDITDVIALPGLFPLPSILLPPVAAGAMEIRNSLGTSILTVTDTEIQLQGAADWAVAFTDMKLAFDTLVANFNSHLHTAPSGGGSTSAPTVSSTADMSGAKVLNVRLP